MLCYITVKPAFGNGQSGKSRISGVFESAEQASRSIGPEELPNSTVFEWPMIQPPRLNAPVEINNGQVVPIKHSRLLDILDNVMRRDEIAHLHQMNAALTTHLSQLEERLQKKPTVYIHDRDSEPVSRQVRDLWLCRSQKDAAEQVVRDFVNAEKPTLAGRIISAPDADLAAQLNTQAQQQRVAAGTIDASQGIAHNSILLHRGDRVHFRRTDDALGVVAGDLGDVLAIYPQFRTIAVCVDRCEHASDVVLVPLREYADVDLGYAATPRNAKQMQLFQAFVLANSKAPTREFIDKLPCFHVEVYADYLSAHMLFPEHSLGNGHCQTVDLTADPLAYYRNRD